MEPFPLAAGPLLRDQPTEADVDAITGYCQERRSFRREVEEDFAGFGTFLPPISYIGGFFLRSCTSDIGETSGADRVDGNIR